MPSSPLTRCWLAPAPAPKGPTPPCCPASLLVALDRCGQTADLSHASHTLARFALFVQVACCGVSPPAALRLARAGTRRAARPRPRPCTQPPPSPQRAIPLPALTLPAPALCRPCVPPRAHQATLLFPGPSLLYSCAGARSRDACHVPASHPSPRELSHTTRTRHASRPHSITQAAHGGCTAWRQSVKASCGRRIPRPRL